MTYTTASHQGSSIRFGFTFVEPLCHPSLYTVNGLPAENLTSACIFLIFCHVRLPLPMFLGSGK